MRNKRQDKIPEGMPNKMVEKMSEKKSGKMPNRMSDGMRIKWSGTECQIENQKEGHIKCHTQNVTYNAKI